MLHKDFLKLYWKQYLSLEKDLLQMDDYVTIDSKNYGCFSNNFAKIFMMACSELDSLVLKFDEIIRRDFFIEKALPKSFPQKLDMLLYKYKNLHNMRISTKADICEINFVPFTNFTENETDGWWKDYNLVKHNRTEINSGGKYNYEKDIIVPLINDGKVVSYKSSEYAKDMGTPERYRRVQEDYNSGICDAKNLANKQKAIFLDRDGTINEYVGFLRKEEDFRLIPGVSEAIKKINNSGYLAIVVTNQPVIARGEVTEEELEEIHKKMETLLGLDGAYIDDIYYCPHHPDKGFEGEIPELKIECDCRKPKTGMLEKAAREHNIDLSSSIMIGDSTLDIKMAENAGMQSILLKTGQKGEDGKYDVSPTLIAEDLNDAINKIICKKVSKKL